MHSIAMWNKKVLSFNDRLVISVVTLICCSHLRVAAIIDKGPEKHSAVVQKKDVEKSAPRHSFPNVTNTTFTDGDLINELQESENQMRFTTDAKDDEESSKHLAKPISYSKNNNTSNKTKIEGDTTKEDITTSTEQSTQSYETSAKDRVIIDQMVVEITKSQNRPRQRQMMSNMHTHREIRNEKYVTSIVTQSPSFRYRNPWNSERKLTRLPRTRYPKPRAAHQQRPKANGSFFNKLLKGQNQGRSGSYYSRKIGNKTRDMSSPQIEKSTPSYGVLPKRRVTVNPKTEFTKSQNRPRQRSKMSRRKGFRNGKRTPSIVTSSPSNKHRKQLNPDHNPGRQLVSSSSKCSTTRLQNSVTHGRQSNVSVDVEQRRSRPTATPTISTEIPPRNENVSGEEDAIRQRTAQFKKLLLKKLRRSPNELSTGGYSRGFPKLPDDILERTLKDNAREENTDDFYAHDKELIITGNDLKGKCIRGRQVTGCYLFVLEGKIRGEVASAQLWLYKTPDTNDISGQTVRVFQLEKTRRGRIRRRNLMIRQDIFVKEGWITMNITRSVKSWVDKRMSTAMMAIRCDTCRTRSHRSLYGAKTGYKPLLVIKYDDSNLPSRRRRTVEYCNPSYECCKRNLVVNFSRLQIGGISQPMNISIGYCFGNCNHSPLYMYNHTTLTQSARMNDMTIDESVRNQLQPCCVPMTFKDTFLLMATEEGIIRTLVPNVIVSSCGCL